MRLPTLTGEFRTTKDPELRFTPAGKAVCSVSIITTESKKNPHTQEWEDGDSTPFINISVWDRAAEAMAEEITKGQRVLVTGQLYVREYDKSDGTKGQSLELKYATVAAVPGGKSKAERSTAGNGYAHGQQQQRRPQQQSPDPWANDPWAAPGGSSDQPPF